MKIFFFALFVCNIGLCLSQYDACQLFDGRPGLCKNIQDCPYALQLLKATKIPQVCNFEGQDVFVCCEIASARPITRSKPGQLSETKCREYYYSVPYLFNAKRSEPKEFTHMAVIGYDSGDDILWGCGGALISNTFVLTAAHCLYSSRTGPPKYVRLGDLDLESTTDDALPQQLSVKRTIPHPDYSSPSKYNDIGLIELEYPVNRTAYVNIACLDTQREHDNLYMTAAGWGKTAFAGRPSSFLLKADLLVVGQETCQKFYNNTDLEALSNGIVDDVMFCAGGESDTCQGDSGGPLFIKNEMRSYSDRFVYNIVGVTSFGKACGFGKVPGVYTRVYNYLQWIEDIVWRE